MTLNLPEYKASPTLAKFHNDDSPFRLVLGPVGCYDGETEYLTPEGWRKFSSGPAPKVAQYDPETQKVSFVEPEGWVEKEAPAAWVSAGGVEQMVSPDHRVLFIQDGMPEVRTAAELDATKSRGRIICAATQAELGDDIGTPDEVLRLQVFLLMGTMWGACTRTRTSCFGDFDDKRLYSLLKHALIDGGFKPNAQWNEEKQYGRIRARLPWRMDVVPTSWWQASARQVRLLFRAFVEWFDAVGAFKVRTRDRRLVDWLQFAAMVSGWLSVVTVEGRDFVVRLRLGQTTDEDDLRVRMTGAIVPVYSFTVPTGFLVVRRGWRVFMSGNSGKSVGCLAETLIRGLNTPSCKDGVRRVRGLVGRRTYAQLKSTTINTFKEWWGPLGKWRYDSPITWRFNRKLADGTTVDLELLFMSLEGPVQVVEDKLKSLELTFAFLNEVPEIPLEIVNAVRTRITRYPKKDDLPEGVRPWFGVWADGNMPSINSWVYQMFEVERPKGWKLFRQPGALLWDDERQTYVPNPEAENIEHLTAGYDYYFNMLPGMPEARIRSLVLAEYSPDVAGKPVYPMFSSREHVASEELKPHGRTALIIGCDWGLNPAAVITMMTEHGALWVLDEISLSGVLLDEFRDEHLLPLLMKKYRSYPVLVVGDPAGQARSAVWNQTVFSNFQAHGIPAMPAWTNEKRTRIQAVTHFLTKRKGLLISPTCVTLREGFEGGYKYRRVSKLGDIYAEEPEKNEYSHVHDALQYAALYYYASVVKDARMQARAKRHRKRQHNHIPRALV